MKTEQHLLAFKSYMHYRRYSPNTIKTYTEALEIFFRFFQNRALESLTIEDIIDFNNDYILKKTYRQVIKIK